MKKKLKIFIPLVLLGVSVSSYGCHAKGSSLRLNRETYNEEIPTASYFSYLANLIPTGNLQFKDGIVQLFDKGTVTANIDFKITFDRFYFSLIYDGETEQSIDIKDYNYSTANKITINWSLNDKYVKFSDENQGIIYVKYDQDHWWECFESNKTRKDITESVESYLDPRNFIFDFITQSLSVDLLEPTNTVNGVYGMDISGFIGITPHVPINDGEQLITRNYLSPMSILSYPIVGGKIKIDVSLIIDIFNAVAPLLLKNDMLFNGSVDLSQNAFCEEIGTNTIDLLELQRTFNSDYAQLLLYYLYITKGLAVTLSNCQGIVDFDFFLNYKNNFIHQEEALLDLKDLNLDLYVKNEPIDHDIEYTNGREDHKLELESEVKKANVACLMNQEVTDTCEVDSVNINDYTLQ